MTATVRYLGDLRTQAVHTLSGDVIYTDAPPDNQGKGEAFSPTDLCATSLACCMLTIMGISARAHDLNIVGAQAEVIKVMDVNPRRISKIVIEITMPRGDFDERQRNLLETAARTCPVSFSLAQGIQQEIRFVW